MLAGTGIVIAADTEETIGESKVDTLKTRGALTAGFAITGSGNSWYIDAAIEDLEKCHERNPACSIDELEVELKDTLGDFYKRHVVPFGDPNLDFQLVIGVQRQNVNRLWVTAKSTMREVYGHQVVGTGDVQAGSVIENVPGVESIGQGVILACCAIYQAKQRTVGCGKSTTVECIYNHRTHYVFPDVIDDSEAWFARYLRTARSTFSYCLLHRYPDQSEHLNNLASIHSSLRTDAAALAERITNDLNARS